MDFGIVFTGQVPAVVLYHFTCKLARNQLGTPGGVKSFLRGPNFLKLCPIVLKYVQHSFLRGKKFPGGFSVDGRLPNITGLVVRGLYGPLFKIG